MTFLPEVRLGERTRFVYASLAFMCVAAGGLVARTVGDTLFLTRFGSERLPLMYIATAGLVGLIAFVYSSGFGRWPASTIIGVVAAVLVVAAIGVRIFLMGGTSASRVLAYLFAEVVIRLPLLLFWTVAALIFNSREAKRLIGPIGAAGTAACIAVGAAIPRLVHDAGTSNLLWLQAALTGAFGVFAVAAARHAPRSTAKGLGKRRAPLSYYFTLLRRPQVRSLAAMIAVATTSLVLTDFVFKSAVRAEFAGAHLAAFFGRFYAVANGCALLLQLLLVHHILARGVGPSLRILPIALMVASAGMAVFGTFGWAVAAKFLEPLLEFTINAAAVQMLYLAVQRQSRSQTRALVDGIVKPAAFAVAGVLLVLASGIVTLRAVAAIVAVGTVVWLVLVHRNARLYMTGLLESIGMRRFDLAAERVEFTDSAVAQHVRRALRVSSDDDIPYLLALLPQWKGVDWTPEYRLLIERPSPEVKTRCLEYLAVHGSAEDVIHVHRELGHENPAVRQAAVHAAIKIGGADAASRLVAVLHDDRDASVRAAAAAELINYGDLEDLILGATTFRSMLASSEHTERTAAAHSLALVERHKLTSSLLQLLGDPDPDVRLVALDAAHSQPAPALLPVVAGLLRDRRVGWKAAQVLPAFGEPALALMAEAVREALLDPPPRFTLHLPHVFAQIGPRALAQLVLLIEAPNLDLSHAAITAYCEVLRAHPAREEIPRLEYLIGKELELARAAITMREAMSGVPGNELLQMALSDEYEQHVDGLMRLLHVVQPAVEPAPMTESLIGGSERRAEALEILDNVLPGKFRQRVLNLFESVAQTSVSSNALYELITGGWSEWVTVGAIYCAGESHREDLIAAIVSLMKHRSAAVHETAEETLRRLGALDDVAPIKRRTL
jgi:AAA family ATP:ADP antiporter